MCLSDVSRVVRLRLFLHTERAIYIALFTSLCHVHHTCILVDSHAKHLSGKELRVLGPVQVQFVQGSAQQLVLMSDARADWVLAADGTVQHHHEQY